MTNKLSLAALIVALAAFIIAIASPSAKKSAPQQTVFARVMQTRTLRCGYAVWNPILTKDPASGAIGGISRDIMDSLAKKLDLRVEWTEEASWGSIVEGLATGRYDMICPTLAAIPARARAIEFSKPAFYTGMYAVVRADDNRFIRNSDLDDSANTLSILDGEAFSVLAPERFPKAKIKSLPQVSDLSALFQDVETHKADATGADFSTFLEYDKVNPGKVKVLDIDDPLLVYPVAFGLPQGDMALKTLIDTAMDEAAASGEVERIVRKYMASPYQFMLPAKPYQPPALPKPPVQALPVAQPLPPTHP